MPTQATGPILADHNRIDVKFTMPKGSVIDGLQRKLNLFTVPEKDAMHAANAVEAGKGELAIVGRHREGRVDTGEPAIQNLDFVQLATLRKAFTNNGWVLSDVFSYEHGRTGKPIFVLRYRKMEEGATLTEPDRKVTEAIRRMGKMTWGWVNVWSNPDGSITINANSPKPDDGPKRALIVNDGCLGIDMIPQAITEEAEDKMR